MLPVVFYIFLFVFFLFFGSFLKVVVDRVIRGEQFLKGRSYCEACNHKLSTPDLIPLFSFIIQKGRCRHCKDKIPVQSLLAEITSGLVFTTLLYWYFEKFFIDLSGLTFQDYLFVLVVLVLSIFLYLIFFSDMGYMLIPDIYLYCVLGIYVIFGILYYLGVLDGNYWGIFYANWGSHIMSAVWLLIFFWLLYFFSKGKAMGEGDVFLAPILGLYLTFELSIVMWMAAFVFGALFGVLLILLNKKGIKSQVPFGPFLVIGFVLAFIFGVEMVDYYLSIL